MGMRRNRRPGVTAFCLVRIGDASLEAREGLFVRRMLGGWDGVGVGGCDE